MTIPLATTSPEQPPKNITGNPWIGHALVHITGVAAIAALLLFVMVQPTLASTVARQFIETPELSNGLYLRILAHLGCSAAVWALLCMIVKILGNARTKTKKQLNTIRLKTTAGTILVETLIILPVLLLLVFGLSQFAINNIAAVLARYAAYSGARTVWIWHPEAQANRKDVSPEAVKERARISVALAMTPVAPGGFVNNNTDTSQELKDIRQAMYNRFSHPLSAPINVALNDPRQHILATEGNKSFTRAVDTASFSTRSARKLTHAYLATEVPVDGITRNNGRIGVKFVYWHHQAMPLVGKVFGRLKTKGNRTGYYYEIPIEYSFPQQRHHVNNSWPQK